MPFQLKRIYDPPAKADGYRVLVDRLWPRGLRKEEVRLDEWNKVLPPSNALRTDFHSGRLDFHAFVTRYRAELLAHTDELERLRELAQERTVTLLYGAKDPERNHARMLMEMLVPGS
ncbi:MAG: DUF488 family protein [Flavobacteriales bacterium]|nr:DUF488 family protein [Flavobacteriales bacterium]